MSQGAGWVMREVEARLTGMPQPIPMVAREVFATETPTRAQIESVRQASRRLRELGVARTARGTVRRPRTEAEQEDIRHNRICAGLDPDAVSLV
jgi:hypothetical protein